MGVDADEVNLFLLDTSRSHHSGAEILGHCAQLQSLAWEAERKSVPKLQIQHHIRQRVARSVVIL